MRFFIAALFLSGLFYMGTANAEKIALRDKIGQMLIIGFEGKEVTKESTIIKAINQENIGGVILFDYNPQTKTFDKNIASPEQVRALNANLQQFTNEANETFGRPVLPLFISVDYEGGQVSRLQENYGFPATVSAATVGKKSLIDAEKYADQMAATLHKAGFNLVFAPDLDVNINPNNPIIAKKERSFSSEPEQVARYAAIYTQKFINHGIQCVYKHFPGHGSSTGDSHLGFVDVTETWLPLELKPFQALLNQPISCGMVMTAHIVNRQLDSSGLPATLSYKILTGILRQQLAYDGVIITDDMQMNAIREHYGLEDALTLAINAGADMFIFGNQLTDNPRPPKEIIDIIEAKVKSGEISKTRIDDAYRRIITLKQRINNHSKGQAHQSSNN